MLSWKLMLADGQCIDYVILHELAHVLHPDHSAEFWAVVRTLMPDYAQCKERLKQLQARITREGWDEK